MPAMNANATLAVFGATGFTGRIAAHYLFNTLKHGGRKGYNLMLVGRSETKLNDLLQELNRGDGRRGPEVIVRTASTDAPHTLDAVASGQYALISLTSISYHQYWLFCARFVVNFCKPHRSRRIWTRCYFVRSGTIYVPRQVSSPPPLNQKFSRSQTSIFTIYLHCAFALVMACSHVF